MHIDQVAIAILINIHNSQHVNISGTIDGVGNITRSLNSSLIGIVKKLFLCENKIKKIQENYDNDDDVDAMSRRGKNCMGKSYNMKMHFILFINCDFREFTQVPPSHLTTTLREQKNEE